MKQHQQAKETMRKTQTENLVRRGKIVLDDGRSDEELRAEAERNPSGFLSQAIMEEASVEAQQAYIDAQSRARDVEMLVRSINEVASMFQDLAVLIQHQSEMLDNIGTEKMCEPWVRLEMSVNCWVCAERNVESAQSYVKKGNENVSGLPVYQAVHSSLSTPFFGCSSGPPSRHKRKLASAIV